MKLSEAKPYFESSEDMQSHFFSIQDKGALFEILRSKMYSNPILAICREITSNARDAHREVGTPDKPIQIHLPFGLEPYWKVKDFGPGISPDRMINIFIKYTASTKREDNVQTGGFGLGAKTPFSYSDTFSVTTVHDGVRYSYTCLIDDTKVGKLVLLDQRPVDEPNSTEISIPIKSIDFNYFRQYTEQSCRHWDVKPTIIGGDIVWEKLDKITEGPGWAIGARTDNYGYHGDAKLIIDGIEYPLGLDDLRKYADPKLIDAARGNFIMYFGVGELSLSATRENIFLDKPTQEKIKDRLDQITKEIRKTITDKIDAFPNLWAANVYYRKDLSSIFNNLSFLGKLYWKNYELSNGYLDVKCNIYSFSRGKYSHRHGSDPNKLTRSMGRSFSFDENTDLYINDLPLRDPTPRHLKKAFEDNPQLKNIVLICPNDKQTEADLNKDIHLDEMHPKKLSSITKASSRTRTSAVSRLLIFKFDPQAGAFRQVSYDNMEEDVNDKVLCLLNRDSNLFRLPYLANKQILSMTALRSLLERNPKVSFYGVDKDTDSKRLDDEFDDFTQLDSFIEKKVLNNKSINYVEIKFATHHTYHVDERMLKHFDKLSSLIDSKQSVFLSRLELHKTLKKLSSYDAGLLDIYESVKGDIKDAILTKFVKDNPNWDVEEINKEYEKKYPLLSAINTYNFSQIVEHVAHYVNVIDKI